MSENVLIKKVKDGATAEAIENHLRNGGAADIAAKDDLDCVAADYAKDPIIAGLCKTGIAPKQKDEERPELPESFVYLAKYPPKKESFRLPPYSHSKT